MTKKELAISETIRLIKTNHKVEDNIEDLLSEVYDLGYHLGTLQVKCSNHRKHPDIIKFKLERDVEYKALYTHPLRIDNKRNLQYNGPEITLNSILVSDMNYNESLSDMNHYDNSYRYFDATTGDKESHLIRMEESYDDDDKEYEYSNYNELEVRILFSKLLQVAMSVAAEETHEMPEPVKNFFSYEKMMKDMKDDGMEGRIASYQEEVEENYPDFESWREFYLD